jgi:surface antigen
MNTLKRSVVLSFTALAVLFSSALLYTEKASAQSIEPPLPLRVNEEIIEQQTNILEKKEDILVETQQDIQNLEEKKTSLANELDSIKNDVENMKQQLAQKKAAAEAERKRVEELKKMFVHINRYSTDASGNNYAPGYCTFYAKSRRPDLPNSLGHANTWYVRAASMGWNVGDTPKKGAVGVSTAGYYGHVVYVEGVSLDGQIARISEMNYAGLGIVSSRTVNANEFKYIYELN